MYECINIFQVFYICEGKFTLIGTTRIQVYEKATDYKGLL